ncbi:pre-mRNA splicing factor component-domain-containing protein [Fomitopsis serialis]|uniref:pre-mRNA splicing factor component-domain-containing protein n=1 Tax=Fomitopsis serialis TaxID=139415 RepID=UPI0020071E76|nr:pre-mRNA splicing factor component-domain-containing protein [Neoantrodia serialis]KAH9914704.1 pre-mRNA splicing factor component-domain-containing protein [Neoantrodia serialis]
MVRIIIKENTEDEVLKAAIAKYGKNQWARISSLLVRKTPKQCKARWYEWLDPSIKKTEWSKTEDEKLLHLAKLMPTQWRTIAPIVGRTATQCLDEKEMLSEARARLANTQGKKAKRKARERQLEEARRLAVLQKKRELKAAGIIMRHKTKRKGMDYNADIPFEKKAAPGFYDTADEQARETTAPVGQSLRRLEGKRKADDQEEERRKRQRQAKDKEGGGGAPHQTKFVAARDAQIQKLKEAESMGRRRKLVLPAAQVGEAELEDIVKIGQAGEQAKALVAGGSDASNRLLSEFEGLERARMARTPRTQVQHDNVMSEARNLRNMMAAQTPLLGDENTPIHADPTGGTGFEGATPRHQVAINGEQYSSVGDTPRDQRMRMTSAKRALKAGFMSLPKPENNFELLVPDEEETEEEAEARALAEEDAGDRDARLRRMREEEERKALARRSQAVQRDLSLDEEPSQFADAEKFVHEELARLLQHDALAHPLPGTAHPGGTRSAYELPPDDAMDFAKSAVRDELAAALGYPGANEEQLRQGVLAISGQDEVDETLSWAHIRQQLAYDASSKTWIEPEKLTEAARIAGYTALLDESRQDMAKEASKAAKAEKKLNVTLGGYQARSKALTKRIGDAFEEMQKVKVDCDSFVRLQTNEGAMGPVRVSALKEEVEKLERRERSLQERYAELETERRESQARVAVLEEKMMAEAEALNEAALAEAEDAAA